jgi:hypothetical protein
MGIHPGSFVAFVVLCVIALAVVMGVAVVLVVAD